MTTTTNAQDIVTAEHQVLLKALVGIPEVKVGDDLAKLIVESLAYSEERLQTRDIVVIAQKIVSKAEGRVVNLSEVHPSDRAVELGRQSEKDPRVVELILSESTEILRVRPGAIIVVHRLGYVLANAGIDASNVSPEQDQRVLLLPKDPDVSAATIRTALRAMTKSDVGVIVNDSLGRAWRNGTIGTALGASGISALANLRGRPDRFGRPLQTTEIGFGDEVAAAASLLMGQADEGRPVVLVRGLRSARTDGTGAELIRSKNMDLFR